MHTQKGDRQGVPREPNVSAQGSPKKPIPSLPTWFQSWTKRATKLLVRAHALQKRLTSQRPLGFATLAAGALLSVAMVWAFLAVTKSWHLPAAQVFAGCFALVPLVATISLGIAMTKPWATWKRITLAAGGALILGSRSPTALWHQVILIGEVALAVGAFGLLGAVAYWRHSRRPAPPADLGTAPLKRTVSSHYTADGSPKKAHSTKFSAKAAAAELHAKDGAKMDVYVCETCKKYHVGHAR